MRKRLFFITIPEDHYNDYIQEILAFKFIIREYLIVKHESASIMPHYHIMIELHRWLKPVTISFWFKDYKHHLVEPLISKSELIAYMLDQSKCVMTISGKHMGANYEKKAL